VWMGVMLEVDSVTLTSSHRPGALPGVQARTRSSSFLEVGSITVPSGTIDFFRIPPYNAFTRRPCTFRKRSYYGVIILQISAYATLRAG
jgi:hypothetical protein